MSKLTMAQRKLLKDDDFADPENRLFPILDQDDVDSAASLIGKAQSPNKVKKRIMEICKAKDLDPPAAWVEEGLAKSAQSKELEMAQMSAPATMSHGQIRTLLDAEARRLYPDKTTDSGYKSPVCYVSDVWPGYFIIRHYGDDKSYKATYSIDKNKKVETGTPEEVIPVTTYEPVSDAVEYSLGGDSVVFNSDGVEEIVREGLIFEAGEYPDKQFDLTPEELVAAVATFTPVDVDYEHVAGPLDGRLGQLRRVWASADGTKLYGSVAIPTWLDSALGKGKRKVSTTWDRSTKTIRGLALTTRPRVADAALMAAFNGGAPMATKTTLMERFLALFEDEASPSGTQAANPGNPASPSAPAAASGTQPAAMSQSAPAASASASAGNDELERLRAEIARERASRIGTEAASFADTEIRELRAFPAERPALIEAYSDAAAEDYAHPREVTFSSSDGEKKGTRVDALKARSLLRPKHQLTTPTNIPGKDQTRQVLMNNVGGEGGDLSADEEEKLLAATPLGRVILEERRAMAKALVTAKSEAGRTLAS